MHTEAKQLYIQALRQYRNDQDEAERLFKRVLELEPDHSNTHRMLGRLLFFQKRHPEAIPHLIQCTEEEKDMDSFLFLSIAYTQLHQFVEAETVLFAILDTSPEREEIYSTYSYATQALHYLGHLYDDVKLDQDAEDAWRATLKSAPRYTKIYKDLAYLFMRTKEFDKAEESLHAGLHIEPDNISIHLALIDVYRDLGDLDKAIEIADRARTIDPNEAFIDNNLAEAFLHNKDYTQAEKYFHSTLKIEKNVDVAHFGLGEVYLQKESYAKAKKSLLNAIAINPRDARYHTALSNALLGLGDHTASNEAAFEASKLSSQTNQASYTLQGFAQAPIYPAPETS